MKNLISKEVFEEVMAIKLKEDWCDISIKNDRVYYWLPDGEYFIPENINIYELAHKCKEWAFEFRFDNKPTNNRYYRQRSGYEDKFNVEKQKREKLGYMTLTFGCLGHTKTFYADTEPEAIFKACGWIRKELLK